jgi:hypothetical protein
MKDFHFRTNSTLRLVVLIAFLTTFIFNCFGSKKNEIGTFYRPDIFKGQIETEGDIYLGNQLKLLFKVDPQLSFREIKIRFFYSQGISFSKEFLSEKSIKFSMKDGYIEQSLDHCEKNVPLVFEHKINLIMEGTWRIKIYIEGVIDEKSKFSRSYFKFIQYDHSDGKVFDTPPENLKEIQQNITVSKTKICSISSDFEEGATELKSEAKANGINIYGFLKYRRIDGEWDKVRYCTVELWAPWSLIPIGSTSTTSDGFFSFDINCSGTQQLYIKVFPLTECAKGISWWGGLYTVITDPPRSVDCSQSSYDFGTWYIDTRNFANIFEAVDNVMTAYQWVENRTGYQRSPINIRWPFGEWPQSSGFEIYLPDRSIEDWDQYTVYHEYGHCIQYAIYGNRWPPGNCPPNPCPQGGGTCPHCIDDKSDEGFAMLEGWAEFFQCAVPNDFFAIGNGVSLENNNFNRGELDGDIIEGCVASIFWDIYDGVNEEMEYYGIDNIDSQFSRLWYIMENYNPDSIHSVWDAWKAEWGVDFDIWRVFYNYGIWKYDVPLPDIIQPVDPIHFPDTEINTSVYLDTTIYNDGQEILTINSIENAAGSDEFVYSSPSYPFNIYPGNSRSITVEFTPSSTGEKTALFNIKSNDPDESNVQFNVFGTGIVKPDPQITIESCQMDKSSYYTGESATLSVALKDNSGYVVEGADVYYIIKNEANFVLKSGYCNDIGNGNYQSTFNVNDLGSTGSFNVEVSASKTGYLSGSCTTDFDVINQSVGHNLRLDQFYTNQTTYEPGDWASFSMQISNIGDFPENVTATLTVTGPNGYFYTKDENKGTLSPNYSTGIFSMSWPIPSNAPHGNYTVKGKASCLSGDEDFSDNTKTVTVSVYDNPPGLIYRSYRYETKVLYRDAYYQIPYWNYQGGWHTTWPANGNTYKIEIGAYVYAGDGTVEKVGMNVYKNNEILPPGRCLVGNIPTCYTRLNHSNYYDNYNLMLFDFFEIQTGGDLAFYISFAAPTNNDSITISPLEAFTKVGQPVNFQVNVPNQSYNSIRVWKCNTNDQPNTMRGQVLSYFSHPGSSYGPFTVTATPTSIDQGTNFAVIVSGSNSRYLLFGKLLVEHSYDARISNITIDPPSPRSGAIAAITNSVENIGSGSLTGIEVYTTITGPGNYYKDFSAITNGGNVQFSWDTLGCLAGVYSINTTISHPNDPNDSNNSMNKTVTLGSPPLLSVSAATDKTSYCPGKTVTVSITVSDDGGVPLSGVFVTCSVIKDNTVIYSAAAGDSGNGNYSLGFTAPGNADDYILQTQADHPRYISGQTAATFSVISCLPEIIIKKGDTEIPPDGTVDFGKKDIDSDTDITFTIENTGKADLTLYNLPITIFGTDDDQFRVEQQPAVSLLEPGNSTSFVIRFTPTTQGTKTAFISLANNDLDKNPYRINLTGAGYIDPLITNISPSSGPVGIGVIISGSNFGSTAGSVTFDGLEAQIESWSETEISAIVPNKAGTGPVIVRTQAGRESNKTTFTVNDGNLFVDNFESYIPGMFPIFSSWQLINPGWGDQYQVIDTSNYNSPDKSFKLEGSSTSPATVVHEYQLPYGSPDGVYYQFWVKVTRLENPITWQPDFRFWAGQYGAYSYGFGSIEFRPNPSDGKEYLFFNDQIGPEVNLGQWYNIKVKYDLLNDTGDVWINNAMVFSQVALGSNSTHYFEPAVTFEGGNDCHTRVWIDDITVYMYMEDSTLTVTSPNGGESWEVGSSQEITWESTGKKGNVKIEYSTNNRASWKNIVTSAANDGSYIWTIPNTPSKNCLIRVSDMDGGPSDVSNRKFSIVLPPSITITSPNGGESWKEGNSYNIAWTSTGPVGNVKIECSFNNGISWTVITSSTTNDGSYMWTVAGTAAENCLIRVAETDGQPSDVSDGVFSIVEPSSLTITSPNGGESLEVGSSHNITWTSSGTVGNVIIEYSTNGGSSWRNIVTLTSNSNNYNWKVPDTPSKNCKVRLWENNTDESPSDVSDAVFSIVSPSSATVKVTSPNGGESLLVGSSHEITWTTTGTIANIKIELSTNIGTSWAEITASTPNDGSYDWTVPGNPSVNCLIRVSETDGNPADVSDAVFSIVAEPDPTITLTSPNGGENLIAGSTHDITWDTTGTIENVLIEYSTNSGGSWEKVVTSTANNGSYNWMVPETPSENCLVRIRASDGDKGPSDISDTVFSIASLSTAAIKVTSPNGGEILTIGSTHEITWTSTGTVGDVKIEYSTDRGTSWIGIVTSATNNGSFNWTVPNDPSSTCLVRISENDTDGGPFDISDKAFSMVSPSSATITVTSPNGGERLAVGGAYIITWTSIGTVENVKIEYSLDSGTSWTGIISSTPNNGMYEWIVPGNPSENCLIRISEIDGDPSDISDGEFSIVLPSSIEVTSPNGDESWEVFSSQNITWASSGTVGNVMIEYSTDRGTSWTNIVTATENDGSYDWTVPDNPSYYCLVRISESDTDTGPSDVSNAEFSIIPPSSPAIAVTYPNGGENLYVDSTYEITWTDTGSIDDIRIEYSINGGTSWTEIIACMSDNGSFDWTVPDNPSENCLIRVSETDGNPVDVSDAEFSIVSPSTAAILVSSPNGGESLAADSTHEITWTSTGAIDKVLIEYSTDEGTSWTIIVTTTDNDGIYIWTVPGTPSDKCLVRISGNDSDGSLSDVSNAVFEITAELNPTITVTSPNGVESLIIGSIHEITWTSTGTINNVMIEYSTDNGVTWTDITTFTPNSGRYEWTVPDTPSDTCLIRITGNDSDDAPSDVSDVIFSIIPDTSS